MRLPDTPRFSSLTHELIGERGKALVYRKNYLTNHSVCFLLMPALFWGGKAEPMVRERGPDRGKP